MAWLTSFSRQTLTTLPILLLSFIYGCKVGYTQSLTSIFESKEAPFLATKEEISWMGSISFCGTPVSVFVCYFFGNRMGRKFFISCSVLAYLIIWTVFLFTSSSTIVIVGLAFYGMAASLHAIMGFIYIGEVATPQNREFLGISYGLMMLIGIGVEFLVNTIWILIFEDVKTQYRALIIFPMALTIGVGILMFFMQESPYYLLQKGKTDKAVAIQAWLMDETEEQVKAKDLIIMTKYAQAQEEGRGTFMDMFEPTNLKIVGLMVWLQGSIMVNSGNVIQQLGGITMEKFEQYINTNIFVHLFNVIAFLGGVLSFITVRFMGRQVLFIVGYGLVLTSHLMIALCHYIERLNDYKIKELAYAIAVLHCMTWFLVSASANSALGVLKTEIFPARLKEFFNAILALSGDAVGFVVVNRYSFFVELIGDEWLMLSYAFVNMTGLLLVFLAVRETRNKSLYEIQTEYREPNEKKMTF